MSLSFPLVVFVLAVVFCSESSTSHDLYTIKMKAVVYESSGGAALVSDRPLPDPRDHYILVKVAATALNPTDWKHVEYDLQKKDVSSE